MKFASKYDLGARVVSIFQTSVKLPPEKCSACDGEGSCELRGQRFNCPKCSGQKQTQAHGYGWVIGDGGVIGRIDATAYAGGATPHGDDEYLRDGVAYTYMLTSSGSGTVYDEANLWPTREEAIAECNRRNGAP